jgi:hypothetical protein
MKYIKTHEGFTFDEHKKLREDIDSVKITPLSGNVPIGEIYKHIFIVLSTPIEYKHNKYYTQEDIKCITIGDYHTKISAFGSISYYKTLNSACDDVPIRTNTPFSSVYGEEGLEKLKSIFNVVSLIDYNDINYQEIENIFIDSGYDLDIENILVILR